jgi:hypothetical protein
MDPFQSLVMLEADWSDRLSHAGRYVSDLCQEHPLIATLSVLAVLGILFFRTALRWMADGSSPAASTYRSRHRHIL